MQQLKNHVGKGDHRQGKRGEKLVTPGGKQSRSSVLNKEQHHAGERNDAENQWNQVTGTTRSILHTSLFRAA